MPQVVPLSEIHNLSNQLSFVVRCFRSETKSAGKPIEFLYSRLVIAILRDTRQRGLTCRRDIKKRGTSISGVNCVDRQRLRSPTSKLAATHLNCPVFTSNFGGRCVCLTQELYRMGRATCKNSL